MAIFSRPDTALSVWLHVLATSLFSIQTFCKHGKSMKEAYPRLSSRVYPQSSTALVHRGMCTQQCIANIIAPRFLVHSQSW